jgi:hypothetical protein
MPTLLGAVVKPSSVLAVPPPSYKYATSRPGPWLRCLTAHEDRKLTYTRTCLDCLIPKQNAQSNLEDDSSGSDIMAVNEVLAESPGWLTKKHDIAMSLLICCSPPSGPKLISVTGAVRSSRFGRRKRSQARNVDCEHAPCHAFPGPCHKGVHSDLPAGRNPHRKQAKLANHRGPRCRD